MLFRSALSRAQPSWNTIGRESYLALGNNSGGGLCSTAAGMGGSSISAEALTPRLMGYGSGSALYLQGQGGGSGAALSTEPPSPRWTKPPAGGAADTQSRS